MDKSLGTKISFWLVVVGLGLVCLIPFFVSSHFIFLFIYPKNLAFRIIVEVIFVAYLYLAYRQPDYRLKVTWVHLIFLFFIISSFISSVLGVNFYLSFWGDIERSEGLITWLHLLMLLVVVSGFLRTKAHWLRLLDVFVAMSVVVMAIGVWQWLGVEWISNTTGDRISSTIGNAAFFAGYLLFVIGFTVYLFLSRAQKLARLYYLGVIFAAAVMILQSGTRGSLLALLSMLVLGILYLVFSKANKKLKLGLGGATAVTILFLVWVIGVGADYAWVQQSTILNRISGISLQARTAQTRLWTWQSAWQGFLERPLLGYGNENFTIPFDRYFNPLLIEDAGSVIWFDRAHNIIFDRLVPGGLIGFGIFLALIGYSLLVLWRSRHQDERRFEYVLILPLAAYLVQNLLVFDSINTFIPFMFLLGATSFLASSLDRIKLSRQVFLSGFIVFLFLFGVLFNTLHLKPAQAVSLTTQGLRNVRAQNFELAIENFNEALLLNTYVNQEVRVQMATAFGPIIEQSSISNQGVERLAADIEVILDEQLEENSVMVRNYALQIQHLIASANFDARRFDKGIELSKQAINLSPQRIPLYHDLGLLYVKKAVWLRANEKSVEAEANFRLAEEAYRQAVGLNPRVVESHVALISGFLAEGDDEKVERTLTTLEGDELIGNNYPQPRHLLILTQWAEQFNRYLWIKKFYSDLLEFESNNLNYMVKLALSHAYLGENDEAIALAGKIGSFGVEPYLTQSRQFIDQVKQGQFQSNYN